MDIIFNIIHPPGRKPVLSYFAYPVEPALLSRPATFLSLPWTAHSQMAFLFEIFYSIKKCFKETFCRLNR